MTQDVEMQTRRYEAQAARVPGQNPALQTKESLRALDRANAVAEEAIDLEERLACGDVLVTARAVALARCEAARLRLAYRIAHGRAARVLAAEVTP